MPLCNGVRPLIEDMPHKDDGNVEIYTSNTTAPILSMLNKVTAEPEVLRNDLENSMMRKGLLTAFGRKQLLDAVYGIEPDPSDYKNKRTGFTGRASDKDRFFRHHLGNKVLRCWVPGKRVKKGAGLHYANEGNATAYVFADVEEEDAKDSSILGQVKLTARDAHATTPYTGTFPHIMLLHSDSLVAQNDIGCCRALPPSRSPHLPGWVQNSGGWANSTP